MPKIVIFSKMAQGLRLLWQKAVKLPVKLGEKCTVARVFIIPTGNYQRTNHK